jgi:hypothetical protein
MEARVEMTLYVLNSSGDRRVDLLHWRILLGVNVGFCRPVQFSTDLFPH